MGELFLLEDLGKISRMLCQGTKITVAKKKSLNNINNVTSLFVLHERLCHKFVNKSL